MTPNASCVRVERLDEAGAHARHAFAPHVNAFEEIARVALKEPSFDLVAELDRPLCRAFCAWLDDGSPAGFLLGAHIADELHIYSVVVDPRLRRIGAGRALTSAAIEDALACHLRLVLLEVRRSNVAAIRLYRQAAFVAVRVRKNYYEGPVEDAIEMVCELAPGALAAFDILDPSLF